MNRFEILRLHGVGKDAHIVIQSTRHIAHQVFDKFRIVISALGDIFFVRPLEQALEFAGRLFFNQLNQFLDPHK